MRLTLTDLDAMTGGRSGVHDVPCPACGPERRSRHNRIRRVLRIWRDDSDFATFCCARCDLRGYARNGSDRAAPPERAAAVRAEIAERDRQTAEERRRLAYSLAARRRPIVGTPAETYLREIRGIRIPLPATLGYLPPTDRHPPAMIACFGLPNEPEPGLLSLVVERVVGVHLTRLRPDGRGKAGEPAKIMIGRSIGTPIVLAPPNDLLGLVICEGLETGLSLAEATGCGVWAAGAANRMPALAAVVPPYIDTVTVVGEPDPAGRQGAAGLVDKLSERGIRAELRILGLTEAEAAA